MEICHILGQKNPEDSLSGQLISDALVRKGSVKDANQEYVMQLRVPSNATDDQIQSALHTLFNSNIQSFQGPHVHSQCPQCNLRQRMKIKAQVRSVLRTSLQLSHLLQSENSS